MDEKELRELKNPENWDWENAENRARTRHPRAIVSVGFSRDDFELVAKCAERSGLRISEFIRKAALERSNCETLRVTVSSVTSSRETEAVFSAHVLPRTWVGGVTRASGGLLRETEEAAAAPTG